MEKGVSFLLILFLDGKKQQEMSYYQPFYYPYFSARAELPPSLQQLDRKLAQYDNATDLNLLLDQQTRKMEIDSIARGTYARAQLQRMNEERRLQAEVQAQMELRRQGDYLQRIAALRRERDLLDIVRQPEFIAKERFEIDAKQKHQATRQSYMTDEQLLRHYATGQKFNEYQREVKEKLAPQAQHQPKQPAIAAKMTYSHETENSPAKIEKRQPNGQAGRHSQRNHYEKSSQQIQGKIERDRLAAQAFKRSYIDELNQSKGNSIQKPFIQKPRGDTIDLLPQSQLESPFLQHKYGVSKNKKKKRVNQSISHIPKKKRKDASTSLGNNRTFTAVTASEAMKKINNRLKVSAIVYKDSKLRNQRHEVEHLFNTFQNEVKGRKDIKDRINNNPDIMRKHNMVVESK